MSTREHYFKLVVKHDRDKKGFNIWKCERCDSEVMFAKSRTQTGVNQIMAIRMHCIAKEFINE